MFCIQGWRIQAHFYGRNIIPTPLKPLFSLCGELCGAIDWNITMTNHVGPCISIIALSIR